MLERLSSLIIRAWKRPLTTHEKKQSSLVYVLSAAIGTVGLSYASVPLYRLFCASTGYGGYLNKGSEEASQKLSEVKVRKERTIRVEFNADTAAQMRWNFKPQQDFVSVHPGETALVFYSAKNPTPKPIIGISTYNVVPFRAANYFNKIQCFCFEEQMLNPGEEVDMPVFFFIDPEIDDDPILENCETITLSYTFFESKPGLDLSGLESNVKNYIKQY
ncbi:LOW QUALITY PROTEIN: cytochrome c oxidase assembly protein COX11, mitochondrial [Lepeophtheirus salmonis]|uniref:Cytochrome c oxidase assembly protein COX11, mitochondrial n=1 Tax=Lepeophtheirus salmonis TaxID=72036 RepID=A0A0K2U261_LEPSM|nr:LOW QUALITY PROTEIN: cytochrome c oxidase assembly protein COX11, mitochondrial-like [Lepeophtheirus salmonis]